MMLSTKILHLLAFFTLSASCSQLPEQTHFRLPGQTVQNVLDSDFDRFVQEILDEWNSTAGLGVAVVQKNPDETWNVETQGYGYAKGDGSKVTEETYFHIGSNSKLFNVFSVGLLISNESLSPRISWDSRIASLLPEWSLNDSYTTSHSTILDLMSHRTGLPAHDLMYEADTGPSELMARSKFLKLSTEFREQFQYNNIMYTVLSYLPERLIPSISNYAQYVKDNIFDPLGLNETTFDTERIEKSGYLVQGFLRDKLNKTENMFGRGTPRVLINWNPSTEDGNSVLSSIPFSVAFTNAFNAVISGAGGIVMSVRNAATWLQSLLLLGKNPTNGKTVIPPEVVQKAATGLSVSDGIPTWSEMSPSVYGGGQWIYSYRGRNIVEHTGGTPAVVTVISRFPFENVGVAVFSNDGTYGRQINEIIKWRIVDQVFGFGPIDWSKRYKSLASSRYNQTMASKFPRPVEPISPSVPFSSIAGAYHDPGYGHIELCLIPQLDEDDVKQSDSCHELLEEVPTRLPDAINTSVPTFVTRWGGLWTTHFIFEHFDGNLFNVTALTSYPILNTSVDLADGKENQTYFTQNWALASAPAMAEIVVHAGTVTGFGLTGFWEAGPGVESPCGDDVQERSEVWFVRER
ncbi:hypothetical protein D9758_001608 [Tetrapyrgos nigripes]|uniref:Beta-lactamase-related domain-containing protein n=1 Tax=Tetrapyrgos nigripes TaxID=182062 RepID=A0A8H5GXW9_9AGAR|nr:hypothetical protein D9758_001608 [Tetrapyrgos nigripes]